MNLPYPIIITSEDKGIEEREGQCDCACPSAPVSFSYTQHLPNTNVPLVKNPLTKSVPLNDNYHALFNPSGKGVSVVNKCSVNLLDAFKYPLLKNDLSIYWQENFGNILHQTIDELCRQEFLVNPETKFLSHALDNSEKLIVWLHVANACNLYCPYCYIQKTGEFMDLPIGRAAIESIFRSATIHGFSTVKLKYAGGEPTLNFPLIISLHEHANYLAYQNNIKLDGVILSNGVGLTSQMFDKMKAHNLRLMLSLDGVGKSHDVQRMFVGGAGSFEVVSNTINRALNKGLVPDISITVTDRTIDSLPETIAWVLGRNLPFSINLYRENDLSMNYEDLQFGEKRIVSGMLAAFKVIEAKLPSGSLLVSLIDKANLEYPHSRTCGVGSNYIVIDHRGNVSKCQMQIEKPVTTVEVIDPLALISADKAGIQNFHVEEKEECSDCEWRYWCAGGCPLDTYRATGRYDVKSPNCNIYKTLYPKVIRLEGLRLLKYANNKLN